MLLNRIFDPSLPEIEGDRDKLHQVFLNLIRNAIEASPEGGEVTIRSSFCSQWQLAGKHLTPQRKYVLIEVQDQGPGGSGQETHRTVVSTPLYNQTNWTWAGFVNFLSSIQSHAGLLNYQPIPGGGALFQVYLPIQQIG